MSKKRPVYTELFGCCTLYLQQFQGCVFVRNRGPISQKESNCRSSGMEMMYDTLSKPRTKPRPNKLLAKLLVGRKSYWGRFPSSTAV